MDSDALRDRWRGAATWLDASPAEVAGLAVLLAGALAVVAVLWWTGRPGPVQAPVAVPTGAATGGAAPAGVAGGAAPSPTGEVTVHVAGAVSRPGLVRVGPGARVAEAIEAAGGILVDADPSSLNLARAVADGERIDVPRLGEVVSGVATGDAPAAQGGASSPARRSDGTVDLNLATTADLETLPGVGPVLADRIVAWRTEHGPFTETGQLREVPGIGEKTFQQLADQVAV